MIIDILNQILDNCSKGKYIITYKLEADTRKALSNLNEIINTLPDDTKQIILKILK